MKYQRINPAGSARLLLEDCVGRIGAMVGWSGAAKVGVAAGGGTMTVVGEGIAVLTGVRRGRRVFVAVSTGIVEVGAARVRVGRAVPAPAWPVRPGRGAGRGPP